jgi:pyridine nucleotide-disulfide oxidoreductase domain-containing protein 1
LFSNENKDHILGIRDTETILDFQKKLKTAKRVLIVGNGGIATELAYEIEDCQIIWSIKDDHMSHMFFDKHIGQFFEAKMNDPKEKENEENKPIKHTKYSIKSCTN